LKTLKPKTSLQLGDMGVGFPNSSVLDFKNLKGKHYWLRGNHDNPEVSRNHPNYIGDYGILKGNFIDGMFNELMYISGAWSIDYEWRIPGLTWWSEEELNYKELSDLVNLYIAKEPAIICSHDCPTLVLNEIYSNFKEHVFPTRTGEAMNSILEHKMPSYWFFAHHHVSWIKKIDGCTFVCLNELEFLDISRRI
jgi:hypothetical protein